MTTTTSRPTIHGECEARFSGVRDAFLQNFVERDEVGAAVSVMVAGRPVVDLWAGHADQSRTRPWERDTIANVYSTTKAMTALCAHQLIEQGRLDLDAPVARYWPEFAQQRKADLPVRWLLSHRAGLAAIKDLLPNAALYDWGAMTTALAAETPWWEPGTAHGYHAVTFGWLVGEVVRRITGASLGTYFRTHIAGPLGADFQIGLPVDDHRRCAEMSLLPPPPPDSADLGLALAIMGDPEGLSARAFLNPLSLAHGPNLPDWRSAEIPGANGHATARGVAQIYAGLANGGDLDGVHLLSPDVIDRCRTEQSVGPDRVLHLSTRFGLGFMLSQDHDGARFGPSPGAFGHPGAGGSVGFADPERQVGFGYVMNRMGPHILLDPRATALIDAVYAAL
jgi:CubicO group peptidase (beta-lactamase class C family)